MKDSKKEIIFKIELSEDDFDVSSSLILEENTFSMKDKTMLLIALHQLKENILDDNYPKIKEVQ